MFPLAKCTKDLIINMLCSQKKREASRIGCVYINIFNTFTFQFQLYLKRRKSLFDREL